ncbi:MFS transporter [Celerinatantimonas yamalensis]
MASAIFTLLIGKLLYDETNSLWAFATASGGEFIIVTIIQLAAGALADRHAPTKILIVINALCMAVFILLAFIYHWAPTVGLLLAAGIVYVFRPLYRTSLFVLVRKMVATNDLRAVNGQIASASQLGQIIGFALTGIILSWTSEVAVFYLMALIYGFCLLLSTFIYYRQDVVQLAVTSSKKELLNWADFVQFSKGHHAFIVRLASSLSIAISLGGFYVLIAPLVTAKFTDNSQWLSWLSVSYALGATISGILVKKSEQFLKVLSSDKLLMINQIISATTFLCCGLLNQLVWLPILLFCFGVTTTLAAVSLSSYLQTVALSGVMGRTSAIQNIFIAAGNAGVAFFCAWIFNWSFNAAAIGLGLLILFIMCLFLLVFRRYPESTHSDSPSISN